MPNQLLRVLLTGAVVFFLFACLFCIEKGFRAFIMEVTDWQHLGAKFLFTLFKGVPHNVSLQVWFGLFTPTDESDSEIFAVGNVKLVIRIATCVYKGLHVYISKFGLCVQNPFPTFLFIVV